MNLNANQICSACNGEFLVPPKDTTVFATSAKIDSRAIECGDMFIALKGKNVDGHKFIPDVLNKKASIVLSEQNLTEDVLEIAIKNCSSIIKVKDCNKALTDVAIMWRKNLMGNVIAITGSVGKTTTKNLIYQTLKIKYQVSANKGNYNNELGLPITLCASDFNDDYVITEMGMSALGEIKNLCKIAQPYWGVITNIGHCHLEFLGSQDNIAKAKCELAQAIPNNIGKMFLPIDDKYRDFIISLARLHERNVKIIYFGGSKYHSELNAPQVWYEDIKIDEDGCPNFIICVKNFDKCSQQRILCKLNIPGKHNVINACASVAVALEADISLSKVVELFKNISTEHGREEILKSKTGYSIINDAYNASPKSMIASIETLSEIKSDGKKIAFLGDMFELGTYAKEGHQLVGKALADNKIDKVVCVGELSKDIKTSAIDNGLPQDNIFYFGNSDDAITQLNEIVAPQDVVLFKASNGMGFQNIVKKLIS